MSTTASVALLATALSGVDMGSASAAAASHPSTAATASAPHAARVAPSLAGAQLRRSPDRAIGPERAAIRRLTPLELLFNGTHTHLGPQPKYGCAVDDDVFLSATTYYARQAVESAAFDHHAFRYSNVGGATTLTPSARGRYSLNLHTSFIVYTGCVGSGHGRRLTSAADTKAVFGGVLTATAGYATYIATAALLLAAFEGAPQLTPAIAPLSACMGGVVASLVGAAYFNVKGGTKKALNAFSACLGGAAVEVAGKSEVEKYLAKGIRKVISATYTNSGRLRQIIRDRVSPEAPALIQVVERSASVR